MANKTILFFVASIVFLACVEPIDLLFNTGKSLLVVDATLDDSDKDQYITLKKSLPRNSNDVTFLSEEGAKVLIIEDKEKTYNCQYRSAGQYFLPLGFKTKVGSKYKIEIELKDGKKYVSEEEIMRFTPDINKAKSTFLEDAIDKGRSNEPGHLIYIDSKDTPNPGDFYVWTYRIFEKQTICKTCTGGIYLTAPAPLGRCTSDPNLSDVTYDYGCVNECWEILSSKELNIMSDTYITGGEIKNRLIAKVPLYTPYGFLIEISQKNIDARAFRYLKILIEQNQTNGSLADSPPAALVGNIKCITDPDEQVGGYFMVGSSKTYRLWVSREETAKYNSMGLLNGRNPNYEPATLTRPPLANCIRSNTRTPLKPEGWPL